MSAFHTTTSLTFSESVLGTLRRIYPAVIEGQETTTVDCAVGAFRGATGSQPMLSTTTCTTGCDAILQILLTGGNQESNFLRHLLKMLVLTDIIYITMSMKVSYFANRIEGYVLSRLCYSL